jgi:FixH
MKMNWGWNMAILYGAFVIGIMFMVIKARSEKVELVVPDYYNQELQYEKRIEATRNAQAHSGMVQTIQMSNMLIVTLPPECLEQNANGNMKIYCPADMQFDKVYDLSLDSLSSQSLDVSDVRKGINILKVQWSMNGKEYYNEQAVYIN